MRYDGRQVTWQRELADTTLQIVGFGVDRDDEMYVVDYVGGIYQFEPNDVPATNARVPPPAQRGRFINVRCRSSSRRRSDPLFRQFAALVGRRKKERLIAIPDDGQIQFSESRGWNLPDHSVVVKTFSLDLAGEAAQPRRVETRLLVRDQGEWTGYSYKWNEQQTDAELVPAEGHSLDLLAADRATDEPRQQTWRFPSRAECMMCHTRTGELRPGPLGIANESRTRLWRRRPKTSWKCSSGWEYSKIDSPSVLTEMTALPDPTDSSVAIDQRARSYLHANCSHCHVSAGGGNARLELEYTTPLDKMNLIGERPLHDRFGIEGGCCSRGTSERSLGWPASAASRRRPDASAGHEHDRSGGRVVTRKLDRRSAGDSRANQIVPRAPRPRQEPRPCLFDAPILN